MATILRNLTGYKKAFALAMDNYHISKKFSKDELYFLPLRLENTYKYKWPGLQIADCRLKIAD